MSYKVRIVLRGVLAVIFFMTTYIVLAGSVSKTLNDDDIAVIKSMALDDDCLNATTFDRQIKCVQRIQAILITKIPNVTCAPKRTTIEPKEFFQRGFGCCYDRVRVIEKALLFYHIKTRHVALYDKSDFGWLAVVVPSVLSHATIEVLTERGWLGVGSNEPIVLITKDGKPLRYEDLADVPFDKLKSVPAPVFFYRKPLLAVYGLYSRHGLFHGVNLPAPEINYPDFIKYNFMSKS